MTAEPETRRLTRSRPGLGAATLAVTLGGLYAALNLYWAAGGNLLLDKYHADRTPLRASFLVWAIVLLVLVTLGLAAVLVPPGSAARTPLRAVAWIAAVYLALGGLWLTQIGLRVEAGWGQVAPADDPTVFRWHAFFWDPWLLVLGVVLGVALAKSARAHLMAADPRERRRRARSAEPAGRRRGRARPGR